MILCVCVCCQFELAHCWDERQWDIKKVFFFSCTILNIFCLSCALKVQLNYRHPSLSSLPLSSCLTSFHSLHRLDKKTTEGGVCVWVCACIHVCLCACTVLSCDLVPSWQQRLVNREPLSHKDSTGHTHSQCQTAGHQLHTWHAAIMSPVCVCVCVRLYKSSRHHLLCPLWTCVHTSSLSLLQYTMSKCFKSFDTMSYSTTVFPLYFSLYSSILLNVHWWLKIKQMKTIKNLPLSYRWRCITYFNVFWNTKRSVLISVPLFFFVFSLT